MKPLKNPRKNQVNEQANRVDRIAEAARNQIHEHINRASKVLEDMQECASRATHLKLVKVSR